MMDAIEHYFNSGAEKQNDATIVAGILEKIQGCLDIVELCNNDFSIFKSHLAFNRGAVKLIEEIGEASKDMSKQAQNEFAHLINWKSIIDNRNCLAHTYSGYSFSNIWNYICKDMHDLKRSFEEVQVVLKDRDVSDMSQSLTPQQLCLFMQKTGISIDIRKLNDILEYGINTESQSALKFWSQVTNNSEPLAFRLVNRRVFDVDFPFLFNIEHNHFYLAQVLASIRIFPSDFPMWDFILNNGETFAHYVAGIGKLPHHFDQWDLYDCMGISVAHKALDAGTLPEHFDQWGIPDDDDDCRTVAHFAAEIGALPSNFKDWSLIDNYYESVAIIAVRAGIVPQNPAVWRLRDNDGWTVAHEMAKFHLLPNNFKLWDLEDIDGRTVCDVAISAGYDLSLFQYPPEGWKQTTGIER